MFNSAQILSFVRWLLNGISGGVIAYTAAKSPAVQGVGAYVAQLITGPDTVAAVVLGVTWLWGHLTHSSPAPTNGSGSSPKTGVPPVVLLAISVMLAGLLSTGCAALTAGADPIVVRAEQTQTVATSTFDTFLQLDNQNRALVITKLPQVHQFAEWLRVPQPFGDGSTNVTARWASMLESVELTKLAYKSNRTADKKANLVTALATLETAVTQTQSQLAQIQNLNQ